VETHKCPDFDYGVVSPGDRAMEFCLCTPITGAQAALAKAACAKPCVECADGGHHWMPDCDDDNGQPVMKCKHCDARREYTDDDDTI
jgi:hypothetical protein